MDKETAKQEAEKIVKKFLAIPKEELDDMPEEQIKEAFIKLMKDKGVYEECSMVCCPKLNSKVLKGE